MFYPGYADSSFFHSERGFSTPTPFGDIVDVLHSDAQSWLLQRYSVVVLAGVATRSGLLAAEAADNLEAAVSQGVSAVITADTARALARSRLEVAGAASGILPTSVSRTPTRIAAGAAINCSSVDGSTSSVTLQNQSLDIFAMEFPTGQEEEQGGSSTLKTATSGGHAASGSSVEVLCTVVATGMPAAMIVRGDNKNGGGGGNLIIFATDGVSAELDEQVKLPLESQVDVELPTPFPLSNFVQSVLSDVVQSQATTVVARRSNSAADADAAAADDDENGITSTTCRRGPGEYTVLLSNAGLSQVDFNGSLVDGSAFTSGLGDIATVVEVGLDQSEKSVHPGYLPEGFSNATIGVSTNVSIAGADTRLFDVTIKNENVQLVTTPPTLPRGARHVALPLPLQSAVGSSPAADSVVNAIRLRPTFFQHFDSAVVDWQWVESATDAVLQKTEAWCSLQGPLRLIVDFSTGINLYPGLRLVQNSVREYNESVARIESVLTRMKALMPLTARDAMFTFHGCPENYYSQQQADADFTMTAKRLSSIAQVANLTLHLRVSAFKAPTS